MSDAEIDVYKRILRGNLDEIIRRLDRLKLKVEQYGDDVDTANSFAALAGYVTSDLIWGLANMKLEALVSNAGIADMIVAEERVRSEVR